MRIMPAQNIDSLSQGIHHRFALWIEGHPLADPKLGKYLASWATLKEAKIAANLLGYPTSEIVEVTVIRPSDIRLEEWK